MIRRFEQRHADIAIEEVNRRLHDRQEQLDRDTDHVARERVTYGDVFLDTSIL